MEKLGGEGCSWQLPALVLALSIFSGLPPSSSPGASQPHRSSISSRSSLRPTHFRFWSECISYCRFGVAISSAAHVPNRLRIERLSIGTLPACALRGRLEYEGLRHPDPSPLRLSSHPHLERSHYGGIDCPLRDTGSRNAFRSDSLHPVHSRHFGPGIHVHDDPRLHRDSTCQNESG